MRFSRSKVLKILNICPSKFRNLTCYTCYSFYIFLQYGLMDLVKSFFNGAWNITNRKSATSSKSSLKKISKQVLWTLNCTVRLKVFTFFFSMDLWIWLNLFQHWPSIAWQCSRFCFCDGKERKKCRPKLY